MSDATNPTQAQVDEFHSAMFAQMVMQQVNLAMMLMGKVPNPQSGQVIQDFDSAQMFIGQLEMLEAKTKGNLTKEEEKFLKQSLMSLQMAFVEAVQAPAPAPDPAVAEKSEAAPAAAAPEAQPAPPAHSAEDSAEDSRKKFSKKY